jgi:hypothetical protein
MKPYSYKFLGAFAVVVVGLTLTGCQQSAPPSTAAAPAPAASPAQPAPTTTTESTSSTRSTEVKTDPTPDGSADKTVTHESTTTTKQRQ